MFLLFLVVVVVLAVGGLWEHSRWDVVEWSSSGVILVAITLLYISGYLKGCR